jgi:hypothetical protein
MWPQQTPLHLEPVEPIPHSHTHLSLVFQAVSGLMQISHLSHAMHISHSSHFVTRVKNYKTMIYNMFSLQNRVYISNMRPMKDKNKSRIIRRWDKIHGMIQEILNELEENTHMLTKILDYTNGSDRLDTRIERLTHSLMELSPSWEAANCAATQGIIPAFYGTRRFITVFTRAHHRSLSWPRSIQSIPSHPISLRSILILSTHLRLGLPSGLSSSASAPISYMHSSSVPFVLHALSISSSLTWSF